MINLTYARGSVWWTHLNGYFQSSVQKGTRPVVIVSSLVGSTTSDLVMVAPLTTKIKNLSIEANIDFIPEGGKKSVVQCNQIQVIPKTCLIRNVGQLSVDDMKKVDAGLLIALGISVKSIEETKSAEAAELLKKNKEALEVLIPQAKDLIKQLSSIVISSKIDNRSVVTKYVPRKNEGARPRRSPEEIQQFLKDWSNPINIKRDVAEMYGFSTYNSAYQVYYYYSKKLRTGGQNAEKNKDRLHK